MQEQENTGLIFRNMAPVVGAGLASNDHADTWDRLQAHFDGIRDQVDAELAGSNNTASFESTNPNNCSPPGQGLINSAMLQPSASAPVADSQSGDVRGPTTSFSFSKYREYLESQPPNTSNSFAPLAISDALAATIATRPVPNRIVLLGWDANAADRLSAVTPV